MYPPEPETPEPEAVGPGAEPLPKVYGFVGWTDGTKGVLVQAGRVGVLSTSEGVVSTGEEVGDGVVVGGL